MTTQQVKQFSYPVVSIYEKLTGELMEQIAALLAKNGEITSTAKWKIKKLAQMGQLNKQNLELIAQYTAVAPELTRIALTDAATAAIAELEPSLRSAANAGFLAQAQPLSMSNGFFNTLKSFERQSESSLNLVNTVMGYKAKQAYVQLVNKISDIESRMEYIGILDKNAASVLTGTQARQTALRQCIKEFSEKGLPAFVDKAGREWTPEAYINMDIRTTVNNCAHQAQFDRMNDYDADLIMTSSHAGARPRCEPYQGKVFSRSGKSGVAEDLNGSVIAYSAWSATSYGEAAGILGINCGHQVYPFVPGYSVQRYKPTADKEQNEILYRQGQKQRYLERKVKNSKRECAMLDKMGDSEGFAKASVQLKTRESSLKQFCETTGRTYKSDRVQVMGFDRNLSKKVEATNRQNTLTNSAGQSILKTTATHLHATPNSITQKENAKGGIDRNFYDKSGKQSVQISNNGHGHKKEETMGIHGEHAHDYKLDANGIPQHQPARELTDEERKANGDFL